MPEDFDSGPREITGSFRLQNSSSVPIAWLWGTVVFVAGAIAATLAAFFELRERVAIIEYILKSLNKTP